MQYRPNLVSAGLWSLCPEPEHIHILNKTNYRNGEVILWQPGSQEVSDSVVKKWEILYDTRIPQSHKVLGLPLRHPGGYTYTFYRVR